MIVVRPTAIFWDSDEKQKVIDTAIDLYPREEDTDISLRQLMKQAMLAGLPPERHRDLRGVSGAGMAWFTEGLKRRMRQIRDGKWTPPPAPAAPAPAAPAQAAPAQAAPAPEPAPGPVDERPASKRGPKTPHGERIRWREDEKAAIVAAAVALVRADPTLLSAHLRDLLRRAMPVALPPERHRDVRMVVTATLDWLQDGVLRGVRATPAPEPAAGPEAEAEIGPDAEGEFEFDAEDEFEDDESDPEFEREFDLDAPGTGFAPIALPDAPAPTPVAGSREQVLSLLAGMNNTDLIGLLLSRLLAERQVDVTALTAMMDEVRAMGERLNAFAGQLAGLAARIAPLEAKATNSNRLLRGVLESLDPDLLRGIEESAADPEPAPELPAPAPGPETVVVRTAQVRPKPRICVLGIKPEQVPRVARKVNGHATVCGVWGDQALKHDFRQYDHVITTPFVSHQGVERVHDQVGKQRWTPVRERGLDRLASGVVDVADRLEDQWRRAHVLN